MGVNVLGTPSSYHYGQKTEPVPTFKCFRHAVQLSLRAENWTCAHIHNDNFEFCAVLSSLFSGTVLAECLPRVHDLHRSCWELRHGQWLVTVTSTSHCGPAGNSGTVSGWSLLQEPVTVVLLGTQAWSVVGHCYKSRSLSGPLSQLVNSLPLPYPVFLCTRLWITL